MKVDIQVNKIYKLSDDYNDIFLNNASMTHVTYNEVSLSSRTIHKDFYEDIFILEPHKTYKIDIIDKDEDTSLTEVNLKGKVMDAGLIPTINFDDCIMYLYNSNENMIFIQQKAIIGEAIINDVVIN